LRAPVGQRQGLSFCKGKMPLTIEPSMQDKPIQLGENLIIKYLDEKTLITGQSRTHLRQGEYLLDAEVIKIEAERGIKVSSRGNNVLVFSCDLTKMEEKIYDLRKE